MNSNWSYSPEIPNLVKIDDFFVPCDLKTWQMTLKNVRAPLPCCFKLCASFRSHWWIQTGVGLVTTQFRSKLTFFLAMWPWNLTDDLEKQKGSSPKQHKALCIISSSYVNSNWSYGPEMAKLGFDLCDLDLWPLIWTFSMDSTFVIGNNSWKFYNDAMTGILSKRCDRQMDGRTDGQKKVFLELLGCS